MALQKKTSLKDIAKAAGVSTALVSFVMNGKGKDYRVNEETARRIKEIAAQMNYQPNTAAQSLRSGKSKTIGFIVSDISNPFFAQLARLLEDAAGRQGYTVVFGSSDENADKMVRIVSNLLNKGVDGLIIVPCAGSEDFIRSLQEADTPLVLFDRYFPEVPVSYVALNNFNAAYTLTRHLLDKGFTAPALIAYDLDLVHMKERIRGYRKAMAEAGKRGNASVAYLKQDAMQRSAARILPKLLAGGTDAFLFATNMISLACLYTIKEQQLLDNHRFGMAAFDGSPALDFFPMSIPYIRQPLATLIQKALGLLIDRIDNGKAVQSVLADGELVVPEG